MKTLYTNNRVLERPPLDMLETEVADEEDDDFEEWEISKEPQTYTLSYMIVRCVVTAIITAYIILDWAGYIGNNIY